MVRAFDQAALACIGAILSLCIPGVQPAMAEGYRTDPGIRPPVHREAWLSDGYWLEGAAETWNPANLHPVPHMGGYRAQSRDPAVAVSPPWPGDYPGYGARSFTDDDYHPDLRPTFTSYDRAMLREEATVPPAGMGFRPFEQVTEAGRRSAPFAERFPDPYAAPQLGRDTYSFRPESTPQLQSPERVSPVWYRERASGRRYLFRPLTQEEVVSRPSDHSFNSSRYAQPAFVAPRYPGPDRPPPVHDGLYGQPERGYSNAGGWGEEAYGGPVYGFE